MGKVNNLAKEAVFTELHPPFNSREAVIEASRCYFCHDAPCMTACPTSIDIPMFIRQIMTDNPEGAAKTIFNQNILGGMCARVCPTETLCEEVCVRMTSEEKPVKIGMLQRYATDILMEKGEHPFTRAADTGKKIAVIGAGPAGISCAHRLATYGHKITIYDANKKAGGLNEYGLATYKTLDNFAQRELDYVLSIGGIEVVNNKTLGKNLQLKDLEAKFDAIFLGVGMKATNQLGLEGESLKGVQDAIEYIADLRQASDLSSLEVGRDVVVIGGGMTAVDMAVQIRKLGAQNVHLVYRGSRDKMKASHYEQELALLNGVTIHTDATPTKLMGENGSIKAVQFKTKTGDLTLAADQLFLAIGQKYNLLDAANIALEGGKIRVNAEMRTNQAKIWAGGDCIAGGKDLTVSAVEDGKIAAESIHKALSH